MNDNTEENDNNEQRKKLLDLGKKIQSKLPKKTPTKTQKEMKYWKDDVEEVKKKLNASALTPIKEEEEEKEQEQEKPCSFEDCSIAGGKKSRKKKTHKRKTRKFKKNRKFKKTSYKR